MPPSDGSSLVTFHSPAVARLLVEHSIDPASITGTGHDGRITKRDVLRYVGAEPTPPTGSAGTAETPASERVMAEQHIPFTRIRQLTAEHMVRSLATAAHTLVVIDVDYSSVARVRDAEKAAFKAREGVTLSWLPFIARAVIDAIGRFPSMNGIVGDDELIVHRDVHLGVAVDLDFEGLVVPVVRNANDLRLTEIARQLADLSDRARRRRLTADDLAGGTFTITNAGGYGTLFTAPIINQAQVAILSTDAVQMRPVAVELDDGTWGVAVHPVGNLALSFDHRAIDGAYASAFLAAVKEILQQRTWSDEL